MAVGLLAHGERAARRMVGRDDEQAPVAVQRPSRRRRPARASRDRADGRVARRSRSRAKSSAPRIGVHGQHPGLDDAHRLRRWWAWPWSTPDGRRRSHPRRSRIAGCARGPSPRGARGTARRRRRRRRRGRSRRRRGTGGTSTVSSRVFASTPLGPCLTMASSTPRSSSASAARCGLRLARRRSRTPRGCRPPRSRTRARAHLGRRVAAARAQNIGR